MSLLKILPNAVDTTLSYTFGNVSATSVTANGIDLITYVQAAYDKANTGVSTSTDQYARDTANAATGVNATQNTNITSVNTYAASAYGVANTNATNIGYVNTYAGGAYAASNTNSTNITVLQGVNATQNTNITAVNTYAASAYGAANTNATNIGYVNTYATSAYGSANTNATNITDTNTYAASAYGKANTVGTLAQAAFDKANTGGGGTSSFAITVDTFSGNGSNTSFTLSAVPSTKNETMVHINGVYQNKNTYSISGSTITFTGVASVSDTIEVETSAGSLMNVAATAYSTRIYAGDGSTNTFTISAGQTANTLFVFNNGICQFPGDDYTISGTTLTYVVTPQADEVVQIREMPVGRVIPTTVPNMRRYTANGVQTTFTVSSGQTANSMFVYENGVCQVPGNDYSVSGTTLTFVTAPTSDKVIQIREMPV